jgi:hypothetical protein
MEGEQVTVTTINIPASIEDAKTGLTGLDRLLQAKQWERAAIVYAFTSNDGRGRPTGNDGNPTFTMAAFAALGITGLKTREAVASYRKAWEDGGTSKDIKPGDAVVLPDLKWKDHFGEPTKDVQARVAASTIAGGMDDFIVKNPAIAEQVARRVIATTPSVAVEAVRSVPAVQQAVAKDKGLVAEINNEAFHQSLSNPGPRYHAPAPATPSQFNTEYWDKVAKALSTLEDALTADKSGVHGQMPGTTLLGIKMLALSIMEQYQPDLYKRTQDALRETASK